MRILRTIPEYRTWKREREVEGMSIGLVPTLGGLHGGHQSLIQRAAEENEAVVVTLFKNPTQFNDPKDLEAYPAKERQDVERAAQAGATAAWIPGVDAIYPDEFRYRVCECRDSGLMEGAHRPGHFEGVLTVVLKLLLLAQAERAYFGEKDYQQLELVRGLAQAFFLATEIVACPTVREADGLACSSRNVLLSPAERQQAAVFPRILREAANPEVARQQLEAAGFPVEYVEEWKGRRLGAVRLGPVRLIDNFPLEETGLGTALRREEAGVL